MNNTKISCRFFFRLIMIALVFSGSINSDLYGDTAHKIKLKPDILFHKVNIKRTGITPAKTHQINIKVSVRLYGQMKTCAGPFKIRVEWRGSTSKPWVILQEAGVAKICYDPASAKADVATRTFADTVPAGKVHYYQITLDPMGQVAESKEGNNKMLKKYKAVRTIAQIDNRTANLSIQDRLPSCEGIDLIVKDVEIIRNSSGNVFIKATIKNLCEGSCTGPIIIEVDESDVIGRPGGVEQPISNGITGKGEFTMFSALGIANDTSRVCSYIVSVRSEGGCIEPAAKRGNNTYSLTVDPL